MDGKGNLIGILSDGTTFKGFIPGLAKDDKVEIRGIERTHPRFGTQIEVEEFTFIMPNAEQKAIQETLQFLHGDLELKKRGKMIFEIYGSDAKRIIQENPYQVIDDVPKIGFKTADEIAEKVGIAGEHPQRIEECVLHVLKRASEEEGHLFLGKRALLQRAIDFTAAEEHIVQAAVDRLTKQWTDRWGDPRPSKIVVESNEKGYQRYYLRWLHNDEVGIANAVQDIVRARPIQICLGENENDVDEEIDRQIAWFESLPTEDDPFNKNGTGGIKLTDEQRDAVHSALSEQALIITGGPGVGKTTIIKAIVRIASQCGHEVSLMAPTGRAAKRMGDAAIHEAGTIHRMMGYNPATAKFSIDENNPLQSSVVICDEASMVDVPLAHALVCGIKYGAHLILVGDIDQLQPVGPGAFFRDLIASETIMVKRLTRIFRQKEESLIISSSRKIMEREQPEFSQGTDEKGDLFLFKFNSADRAAATIAELVTKKVPDRFNIPTKDIQILAPMHRGHLGVDNLNLLIQKAIHGKNADEAISGKRRFLVGDRVIQTKNNYDVGGEGKSAMNGDIGYVMGVEEKKKGPRVIVEFQGQTTLQCAYTAAELDELKLAYAITIHKSQGGEYQAVIVVVNNQGAPMGFYSRNMLYTAMTRGKRIVIMMAPGDNKTMDEILKSEEPKRNTVLAPRIKAMVNDSNEPYVCMVCGTEYPICPDHDAYNCPICGEKVIPKRLLDQAAQPPPQ